MGMKKRQQKAEGVFWRYLNIEEKSSKNKEELKEMDRTKIPETSRNEVEKIKSDKEQ